MCAWCPHADVIGVDFQKHLRIVHGYDFHLSAWMMCFIVELKAFYRLEQCFKCERRITATNDIAAHERSCEGKTRSDRRVYIVPHNAADFFRQHDNEMMAMRNRPDVRQNPTAIVRVWLMRSKTDGDIVLTL